MNILISNDDGIEAPGITLLYERLKNEHKVFVIAPDSQKSASSHSISLRKDILVKEVRENCFSVSGTPADCIILAKEVIKNFKEIDLILTGINSGQNLGEDIYYSGTVAAAREGMFQGKKSIALSMCSFENCYYDLAVDFISFAIKNGIDKEIGDKEFLNINFPNLRNKENYKGTEITFLGHRKYENSIIMKEKNKNEIIFSIDAAKQTIEFIPGSDFTAIHRQKISLTPIKNNLSNLESFSKLNTWLNNNKF